MKEKETVRTRIAPSPTGYFHIGTARTALFNYLYAKKNKGEFIVRIEDTDKERSEKKYEEDALESLKWLGLEWDGEVVRQSERTEIYKKYLVKLLEEGKVYWCVCTKEELEAHRNLSSAKGGLQRVYSGKCRDKSHLASDGAVI